MANSGGPGDGGIRELDRYVYVGGDPINYADGRDCSIWYVYGGCEDYYALGEFWKRDCYYAMFLINDDPPGASEFSDGEPADPVGNAAQDRETSSRGVRAAAPSKYFSP